MKLINDFFNIVDAKTEEGVYRCKVKLNADHALYKVHFPGNPITPGVCLVQMASEILSQQYGKDLLLCKAGSIKFKKPVVPNDEPTFVFSKMTTDEGRLKAQIFVEDEENQFAKMSLTFCEVVR